MNRRKNIWLRLSLYTSTLNWDSLIRTAVIPFLLNLRNSNACITFRISFDHLYGDNIRIAMLVPAKDLKTAYLADQHFKNWFKSKRFEIAEQDAKPQRLFMPIPQNSVQYGLFNPAEPYGPDLHRALDEKICEAALIFFSEEIFDDGSRLTFGVFILSIYYRVIRCSGAHFITNWIDFNKRVSALSPYSPDEKMLDQIDNLQKQMQEIFLAVILSKDKSTGFDVVALEFWISVTWNKFNNNEDQYAFFSHLNFLLKYILGLNQAAEFYYNSFICKIIPVVEQYWGPLLFPDDICDV